MRIETYILSAALVDEMCQKLSRQPYAEVFVVMQKLQVEVAQQQAATPPMLPKDHNPDKDK